MKYPPPNDLGFPSYLGGGFIKSDIFSAKKPVKNFRVRRFPALFLGLFKGSISQKHVSPECFKICIGLIVYLFMNGFACRYMHYGYVSFHF